MKHHYQHFKKEKYVLIKKINLNQNLDPIVDGLENVKPNLMILLMKNLFQKKLQMLQMVPLQLKIKSIIQNHNKKHHHHQHQCNHP
jgi:hypothetical protein